LVDTAKQLAKFSGMGMSNQQLIRKAMSIIGKRTSARKRRSCLANSKLPRKRHKKSRHK
jgi:hypothetical protein